MRYVLPHLSACEELIIDGGGSYAAAPSLVTDITCPSVKSVSLESLTLPDDYYVPVLMQIFPNLEVLKLPHVWYV